MNVYRDLCTPILEELVENRAFDLIIPADSCDLSNVLDYEEEEDRNITNNNVVKRLTSLDGCKSYAQILAVVALVAELKSERRTVSLRDVYYALKSLFRNQRECNDCILQVGRLLSLRRYEMNITPASKGLVSGPVRFRFHTPTAAAASDSEEELSMESMDIDRDEAHSRHAHILHIATTASSWSYSYEERATAATAVPIPQQQVTESVTAGCMLIGAQWSCTPAELIEVEWCLPGAAPRWLLVVEKEGVFRRLLEDQFPIKMNCILVTGCGYPDIATRALVSKLSTIFPTMKIVGVCDYNPHGVALLLTYRFPSASAAYESSGLQAPLRWLGLRSKHIQDFCSLSAANMSTNNNNTTTTTGSGPTLGSNTGALGSNNNTSSNSTTGSSFAREHLQKLALSDTRKLTTMISTLDQDRHADLPAEYRDELQAMLQGGVKCEIESSYSLGLGLLPGLLRRALLQQDYL